MNPPLITRIVSSRPLFLKKLGLDPIAYPIQDTLADLQHQWPDNQMYHHWLYHHLSMTKPLLAILLLLPLSVSAGELDGMLAQ